MMRGAGSARRAGWTGATLAFLVPAFASAQAPAPAPVLRITVPTVIVTAQKEPANPQTLPVSLTAISRDTILGAGIDLVSDAAVYAPNTFFSEFSARKLSFPHFRGISSGPGNPAITTYVDGVPQLHTNASSAQLLGVEQIEFVRGGQSALFGRNALGGVISLASERPSLARWGGTATVPIGNFGSRDVRAGVSGPLSSKVALGVAAGLSERDGFTTNDVTGHALDNRSSTLGKIQLLWTPTDRWETRAIVSGERARDGDYALHDLGALRTTPFHSARDFEGSTNRDVVSTSIIGRHTGSRVTFSTTTGVVRWKTEDETDLDYTPLPLVQRTNAEESLQLTQEVRFASSAAPIRLSAHAALRWQAGAFAFTQGYDQDAVNAFSPLVLNQAIAFPVSQHSPQSSLDDRGLGLYGQGTITVHEHFDLGVGARLDHERKLATLDTYYAPQIAPPTHVDAERSFSAISPNLTAAFRIRPERMLYASVGRGFKAGGFNAASPAGGEAFGEEHAWHIEGGAKTMWAAGRLVANIALFHIDWQDLQLNLPNPAVPAQFYVANVGTARSAGIEAQLNARPNTSVDLFGALGYVRARFGDGSLSSGVNVGGNDLPTTPGYSVSLGAQVSRPITASATIYGRADASFYGSFFYDDFNSASQEAFSLVNVRAGLRHGRVSAEAWTKNAFDTRYIPLALPYGSPSGFIGEMGHPRTFGLTMGIVF